MNSSNRLGEVAVEIADIADALESTNALRGRQLAAIAEEVSTLADAWDRALDCARAEAIEGYKEFISYHESLPSA